MISDRCPVCESSATERVHTEREMDLIEDTYVCEDCHAEWIVSFGNPSVRDVREGSES